MNAIAALRGSGYTPAMIPVLLAGALTLAAVLLILLRDRPEVVAHEPSRAPSQDEGKGPGAGDSSPRAPRPGSCTLCGTVLRTGERMKSDILPGEGDRLMRIFGCVHCLGERRERLDRHCPVCGSILGPGDHAIARYFERPGRKHVHILGCTICRKSPKEVLHGR